MDESQCADEAHGDQAEGQKQSKVEQTQMGMVRFQDDPASQQGDVVGKLQEDRSNVVRRRQAQKLRVFLPKSAKAATASHPVE